MCLSCSLGGIDLRGQSFAAGGKKKTKASFSVAVNQGKQKIGCSGLLDFAVWWVIVRSNNPHWSRVDGLVQPSTPGLQQG